MEIAGLNHPRHFAKQNSGGIGKEILLRQHF